MWRLGDVSLQLLLFLPLLLVVDFSQLLQCMMGYWRTGKGEYRGQRGSVCSLSHLDTLDTFTAAPCKCCLDNLSQSPESYFWLYVTILLKYWRCQKFLLTIPNYLILSAISKLFKYLKKENVKNCICTLCAWLYDILYDILYVNVYNVHKWQMTY